VALADDAGHIIAPMVVARVNILDCELLPASLTAFRRVVRAVRLPVKGALLNLDSGFDSKRNRKAIWNAGLIPNIPENPRNRDRTKPKRGRPRHFDLFSYRYRFVIERSFAWEDTYRSLVIRYDRKQSHVLGRTLLAFTLINLRGVMGNSQ
jgi:transposase